MWTTVVLCAVAALAAGAFAWMLGYRAGSKNGTQALLDLTAERAGVAARQEEAVRRERETEQALAGRDATISDLQRRVSDLREEQGRLVALLEAERRTAAEKLALLHEAEAKLRDAFSTLSAEALRTNSQSFLDLAKASLSEYQRAAQTDLAAREKAVCDLVKPLRDSLEKVDATIQNVEKERISAYASISEQIKLVTAGQQGLQAETANLVKALREPKARGRWGEIQLRRVVEMSGMLDHCDFFEQQSMSTEESRLIPDLVVQLPGHRSVIVDAKVPLLAYLEAAEAQDDATRDARLKDHARQVREHMKKLALKAYWEQVQPAPEFVVMFLPGEPFFSAALLHDPALIEWGVEQGVILASPITLIALLRAVAYGWRQEQIAENAQEISELGRMLYDRLRVVVEHVADVGDALEKAVGSYNHVVGSIESRLLATARRLKDLGAGASKDLPEVETVDRTVRKPSVAEIAPASAANETPIDSELAAEGDVEVSGV